MGFLLKNIEKWPSYGAYAVPSKLEAQAPPGVEAVESTSISTWDIGTTADILRAANWDNRALCIQKKINIEKQDRTEKRTIPFLIPHGLQHPNNLILLGQSEFSTG